MALRKSLDSSQIFALLSKSSPEIGPVVLLIAFLLISLTNYGACFLATRNASEKEFKSVYIFIAYSGFLAETQANSAFQQSERSIQYLAQLINMAYTEFGSYYRAICKAEWKSVYTSYIFIASEGLPAFIKCSSASLYRYSSSKYKAYFR